MTYYDEAPENDEDVAMDERLSLMQQYVDLDGHRRKMEQEQKHLAEKSQKIALEQKRVRERLGNLLGFDPRAAAKASLDAEVAKLR